MKRLNISLGLLLLLPMLVVAQGVDIGAIGKGKAFKISGGVSANSVFNQSSEPSGREAFTYFYRKYFL